jgi:GDP-4-dehydro-6-deoxy-D-mannose reductase
MSLDRILVTGAEGFVGRHLVPALGAAFPAARIIGTSRMAEQGEVLEVTDAEQTFGAISRLQPDACIHLAGIAAIGAAQSNPRQAWEVNLHGTLNVANAILSGAPQCRMIFISSAECYGASFKAGLPLNEEAALAPMNLYAATKAAAELALGVLAGEGLRLLRLAGAAGNRRRRADPGARLPGHPRYLRRLYREPGEIRQPAEQPGDQHRQRQNG